MRTELGVRFCGAGFPQFHHTLFAVRRMWADTATKTLLRWTERLYVDALLSCTRRRRVWRKRRSRRTKAPTIKSPPVRGYSQRAGKSLFARDCVVGLRGLELRGNHAVAIEPISGRGHLADFLRSNVAELPKNPPERTGNQLQKERYYRNKRG